MQNVLSPQNYPRPGVCISSFLFLIYHYTKHTQKLVIVLCGRRPGAALNAFEEWFGAANLRLKEEQF